MTMNFMKISVFFFLIFLICFGGGCTSNSSENDASSPKQKWTVEGVVVSQSNRNPQISLLAEVVPWKRTELSFGREGVIMKVYVSDADMVTAGQLLASIDDRVLQIQLATVIQDLALVQLELQRKKSLFAIQAISAEEWEKEQERYLLLESRKKELEVMIDECHLRAPYTGQLGMVDKTPGAFIPRGGVFCELISHDYRKLNVFTTPDISRKTPVGTPLMIPFEHDTLYAEVTGIHPVAQPGNRNVQLRALLKTQSHLPMPGMGEVIEVFAPGRTRQEKAGMLIPTMSLIYTIEGIGVFLVKEGLVQFNVVEVSHYYENSVELSKGLEVGDTLLTTGLLQVKGGTEVLVNLQSFP